MARSRPRTWMTSVREPLSGLRLTVLQGCDRHRDPRTGHRDPRSVAGQQRRNDAVLEPDLPRARLDLVIGGHPGIIGVGVSVSGIRGPFTVMSAPDGDTVPTEDGNTCVAAAFATSEPGRLVTSARAKTTITVARRAPMRRADIFCYPPSARRSPGESNDEIARVIASGPPYSPHVQRVQYWPCRGACAMLRAAPFGGAPDWGAVRASGGKTAGAVRAEPIAVAVQTESVAATVALLRRLAARAEDAADLRPGPVAGAHRRDRSDDGRSASARASTA